MVTRLALNFKIFTLIVKLKAMDEKLLKSVNRKLRLINLWLSIYTIITVAGLILITIVTFKIISYINDLDRKIDRLNPKSSYCQDAEPGSIKDKICN
jgi:hypothetical protein